MVNNKSNNNKIENFTLPRLDWHDQVSIDAPSGEVIGRLYKDALIEDFNAIEDKSRELQTLDVFDVNIPDPSGVVYPDSTLDSPDNTIINLNSLINILNLNGYILEANFSGNTCKLLKYYEGINISLERNESSIITLKNKSTGASASKPYVYLNLDTRTIYSANSAYGGGQSNSIFIGYYTNNKIIHQRSQIYPNTSTIKGS